jgi:hypothetical protein
MARCRRLSAVFVCGQIVAFCAVWGKPDKIVHLACYHAEELEHSCIYQDCPNIVWSKVGGLTTVLDHF